MARSALAASPGRRAGLWGWEMGQRDDPSWATVAVTTVRLWLQRRKRQRRPRQGSTWAARHQRGVLALGAVGAMAFGALVTLALSHPGPARQAQQAPEASSGAARGTPAANATGATNATAAGNATPAALRAAAATRAQAAEWIVEQVLPSALVGCDPLMCQALQAAGVSASRLLVLQPSTPDPLGAEVIVATQALRSQFGPRLVTVYAPLLLASFGSGAQRIDVRYLVPGGTAAFEASLAPARRARIEAGEQLLRNKNVRVSPQARQALMAGDVDPRLLVTLSLLSHQMSLHLVAFDDPSPGASPDVPLRGAEIGAASSADLSAMLAFLAQQTTYQPSHYHEARIASGQVVTIQYDAPGPLGLNGP
jgi:hypothetical protein